MLHESTHQGLAPPRRRGAGRPAIRDRFRIGRRGRGGVGQSLVEFAIIVPVLLLLVGMAIDVARLYQIWTNLESATRDAAQYLATSDSDPDADNYTVPGVTADPTNDAKAKLILDAALGRSFNRSNAATLGACAAPTLTTVTSDANTAASAGGSGQNPVQTVVVKSCVPFRTLLAYPIFTIDGDWILTSSRTYTVVVGR